ncbi:hypothetical protein F9C07_11578 [Aspergillus flavus]|uniref:Uncharacterized protein n=1 Tax=Aspergillus flavus (strain ATCC 200026 / FGSC A1120 / IAM 13836 / NRRL 3357 / JCM 12722 / SRRC 167) TaxID=332952 RepID=A0A7U2N374_ASPFN|nr:hypothetical protein F9C07_11578 [Aspergillus flavus]
MRIFQAFAKLVWLFRVVVLDLNGTGTVMNENLIHVSLSGLNIGVYSAILMNPHVFEGILILH